MTLENCLYSDEKTEEPSKSTVASESTVRVAEQN